jgi:hypothetical protein
MNVISPYVQLCKNALKCKNQMSIEKKSTNIKLKPKRKTLYETKDLCVINTKV